MWNLSLKSTEILLEIAEDRLGRLVQRLDSDAVDDDERYRLSRAVAELKMLRDERLPMRQRIVLGCAY